MAGLIITVIFLLGYSVSVTVALVKQVQRERKLENITNMVVGVFEDVKKTILDSKKVLDNEQLLVAFSHDDEVGQFFENIKHIQETLEPYTKALDNEE